MHWGHSFRASETKDQSETVGGALLRLSALHAARTHQRSLAVRLALSPDRARLDVSHRTIHVMSASPCLVSYDLQADQVCGAGADQVIIVGEPVGDRLDFWAEGGTFNLPNAFVQVHYASGRYIYDAPCRDRATCFWLNDRHPVRVRTLEPDIAAPLTFAAYRELRDPAMEAVLAHQAAPRLSAPAQ